MSEQSKTDKDLCKMITPKFRISHPHLKEPQAMNPNDKKKFQITMLFPKDEPIVGEGVGAYKGKPVDIKTIIKNAKIAKYGSKENWPKTLLSPVRDGDGPDFKEKDGTTKEGYAGMWVIKATSNADSRPGLVDRNRKLITDPAQVYPGCYARAYIFARVWEFAKKEGVQFILDGVQKLEEGKAFGGKRPVEQVFSAFGGDEDEGAFSDADDDNQDFM